VTTHEAARASAIAARHSASRSDNALATLGLASPRDATVGWILTAHRPSVITLLGDCLRTVAIHAGSLHLRDIRQPSVGFPGPIPSSDQRLDLRDPRALPSRVGSPHVGPLQRADREGIRDEVAEPQVVLRSRAPAER